MLLLPNLAGNNKIITPQEEKLISSIGKKFILSVSSDNKIHNLIWIYTTLNIFDILTDIWILAPLKPPGGQIWT